MYLCVNGRDFSSFFFTFNLVLCCYLRVCILVQSYQRQSLFAGDPSENQRLCIYDWELATKSVPQRDIAEFLLFTCSPETSVEEMLTLLRYYKDQLELTTNQTFEWERFVLHMILDSLCVCVCVCMCSGFLTLFTISSSSVQLSDIGLYSDVRVWYMWLVCFVGVLYIHGIAVLFCILYVLSVF